MSCKLFEKQYFNKNYVNILLELIIVEITRSFFLYIFAWYNKYLYNDNDNNTKNASILDKL